MIRRRPAPLLARIAVLGIALMAIACGGSTEGRTIQIELAFEGSPAARAPFTTGTGWEVELSAARVALGPIYLFAPEGSARARSGLLVSTAHAHGGVDVLTGRRVRAELLEPVMVDALAERAAPAAMLIAEAGPIDAAMLEISRVRDLPEGEARALYVAGTARRAGDGGEDEVIAFEGVLALGDPALERRIEITREAIDLEAKPRLTLRVQPEIWLDGARFERLAAAAPNDPDAPRPITAGDQVGRALRIGARSPDAYALSAGDGS